MTEYDLHPDHIALPAVPRLLAHAGYLPAVRYHQVYYAVTRGDAEAVQDRTKHWFIRRDKLADLADLLKLTRPETPQTQPDTLTREQVIGILLYMLDCGADEMERVVAHRALGPARKGYMAEPDGGYAIENFAALLLLSISAAEEISTSPRFRREWNEWKAWKPGQPYPEVAKFDERGRPLETCDPWDDPSLSLIEDAA